MDWLGVGGCDGCWGKGWFRGDGGECWGEKEKRNCESKETSPGSGVDGGYGGVIVGSSKRSSDTWFWILIYCREPYSWLKMVERLFLVWWESHERKFWGLFIKLIMGLLFILFIILVGMLISTWL